MSRTNAAVRAVEVLALLARAGRPVPAGGIARACSIPRSTNYPLLNSLAESGFVERADGGYRLGPRAHGLVAGATIARAVAVLEAFDHTATQLSKPELCRRANVPLDQLDAVLAELAAVGLVAEADGRYALGVGVAALAARSGPLDRLRTVAHPVLVALRDRTGETTNLVVRDRDEAVYLDQVESFHALRHAGWAGRRIPLASGAVSAALTGASGAQTARDAVEVGVTAVACRVPGVGDPVAALSITAPTARMTSRRLVHCRKAVLAAVEQLADQLPARAEEVA